MTLGRCPFRRQYRRNIWSKGSSLVVSLSLSLSLSRSLSRSLALSLSRSLSPRLPNPRLWIIHSWVIQKIPWKSAVWLRATSTRVVGGSSTKSCGNPKVNPRGSRTRNVQRFQGGLVFKAHRLCVSLISRLESNKEEAEGGSPGRTEIGLPPVTRA